MPTKDSVPAKDNTSDADKSKTNQEKTGDKASGQPGSGSSNTK